MIILFTASFLILQLKFLDKIIFTIKKPGEKQYLRNLLTLSWLPGFLIENALRTAGKFYEFNFVHLLIKLLSGAPITIGMHLAFGIGLMPSIGHRHILI